MLPLSLRRQSRRALYVGLLVVMVAGVAAALVPVGPAVARPRRADLAVAGMVAGPAQVLMGEIVGIGVTVANVGTRVADTVTVYVTLPPTLQPPSPRRVGLPLELRCARAGLAVCPWSVGARSGRRRAAGPRQGRRWVARGCADGDRRGHHDQPGAVDRQQHRPGRRDPDRGGHDPWHAWIDADRDGQREPGELPAGAGIGLGEVRVFTEDGSEIFNVPVDAEGHYSLAVKPNRYYVEATISVYGAIWDFTTPNVGDEATDSDVVWVFADAFSAIAESHVFEVASGSETIIDVGLIEEPLI